MLRAAAFQRRPLFDSVDATIERLASDLMWCESNDINLAVFPECYLQGYASDRRTIERRALSLDGEGIINALNKLSSYSTDIILGLVERRGSAVHNTAVLIRQGRVVGSYAKQHTNERGFDSDDASPVFDTHGWCFGINICYDANFPETAAKLSRQGARLICYPLNNMLTPTIAAKWRHKSIENLQHRAIETGCWVISSDVVGNHADKMSYGCTCIVRPDGVIVQQVPEGTEGVAIFDLSWTIRQIVNDSMSK